MHYLEPFLIATNQSPAVLQDPLSGSHTASGSWQGWVKLPLMDVFCKVGLGVFPQLLHLSMPQQKRGAGVGVPIWHCSLQQEHLCASQCLKCKEQPELEPGICQQNLAIQALETPKQ